LLPRLDDTPASTLGNDAVVGQTESGCPGGSLFFTGEVLFIHPARDGLETAIVSHTANGVTGSTLESLSWEVTTGFRVGAGYRLPDNCYDLSATYMYFHARDQHTVSAPDGSVQGLLSVNPDAQDARAADGDAGLSYNVLDLDLGKSLCLGETVGLRLFGGARLASIDQSLKCIYSGGALGDGFDYVNSPVHFRGAGLTAGAEGTCNLWRGWGLYGKARFGLLSGEFNSKRTETLSPAAVSTTCETFDTIVPVAELGAGFGYQGERFFFRAGYEMTDWFNMVTGLPDLSIVPLTGLRRRGDLTLESLTLSLGFSF